MHVRYIYVLIDPVGDQDVRYVGKTANPRFREFSHVSQCFQLGTIKDIWLRTLVMARLKPLFSIVGEIHREDKFQCELEARALEARTTVEVGWDGTAVLNYYFWKFNQLRRGVPDRMVCTFPNKLRRLTHRHADGRHDRSDELFNEIEQVVREFPSMKFWHGDLDVFKPRRRRKKKAPEDN